MKQLEFASHPGNLSLVRNFVRNFVGELRFTALESDLIVLGIDEACTNIMRHAYKEECTHPITLICERLEDGVKIRLRDYGVQSDPELMQGRPLDAVQPGGLGLHLIRRAFDEVNYRLKKRGTELILIKRIAVEEKPVRARKRTSRSSTP